MKYQIIELSKGESKKSSGRNNKKKFPPVILRPFSDEIFSFLQRQVSGMRNSFAGAPYPDLVFNRHYIHNPEILVWLHETLVPLASKTFGQKVKASYVFLSLYGDKGICPKHTDRPQCKFTIDLCIAQKKPWDIFVEEKAYTLKEGEALCFSGTDQEHWREPIQKGNFCDLAFFHFVPVGFKGGLS
jgi:hypothetical protein